jgi:hypothetical protein
MAERKGRGVSSGVSRRGAGAVGGSVKRAGSAGRGATSVVSGATGADAVDGVGEQVQNVAEGAGGAVERAVGGGEQRTVGEELRQIVRETALEVLTPVARQATTQAARYAIRRGPQLARDTIVPKLTDTLGPAIEEAGGPGAFAKGALSSVSGARTGMLQKVGIGGESAPRPWRERRLPVEESVDVVVTIETAYDRFTEFEEYARLLSRGEVVDERPNERIAWERTDGVGATAVITFHRLSDRLTRVMVTYEHDPQGLIEKTTALLRTSRRALTEDLMRFKVFAEMTEEDTETPEVEPEDDYEEELEDEYEEPEGEEKPEGAYEEEPEEEEEEPPPAPKRPVRRRPAGGSRQPAAKRR